MSKTPEKMLEQAENTLVRISEPNQTAVRRYLKMRRVKGIKTATLYSYALVAKDLDDVTQGTPLRDVTADQVLDFLIDLTGRSKETTKVTYVRYLKVLLRHIHEGSLPYGLDEALTVRDPPVPDQANLVTGEHLLALLGACVAERHSRRFAKVEHNQALLLCLWDSGMRISELLSLKLRDVEFQDLGVLFKLDPLEPNLKSGPRTIYVEDCAAALKAWLGLHPCPEPQRYIFMSDQSGLGQNRMPDKTVDALLKRLAARAGLFQDTAVPLSPHDFRHSSATRRASWGEGKLRLFHGWKRNSKMPARYVHFDLEALRETVRRDAGLNSLGLAQVVGTATKTCPTCAEDIKAAALSAVTAGRR